MKKVLKKKNGKLTQVYAWAVKYSLAKTSKRRKKDKENVSRKPR